MVIPALTTVAQPAHQMGYLAGEILLQLAADADSDVASSTQRPTTLQQRGSLGPPRGQR